MQKILLLFAFPLLTFLTSTRSYGQDKTIYDQLVSINPEWKNQPDIDPLLKITTAKELKEQQLIQLHLSETEKLLRKRNSSTFSLLQQNNRAKNLDILYTYMIAGKFPINNRHNYRQPYFIDDKGTFCAAGYLMKESGAENVAREIQQKQNYGYLKDIDHPQLMNWVEQSGLTFDELALIQPAYNPGNPPLITEFHYNNVGADINEYIEVIAGKGVLGMSYPFSGLSFYNEAGTIYKTLTRSQMQTTTSRGQTIYHYTFPAGEDFADKGKIEILISDGGPSPYPVITLTYTDASVIIADYALNPSTPDITTFPSGESESTASNFSLNFCGTYGRAAWYLVGMPRTSGSLNGCVVLPIKLNKFSYVINEKKVNLLWETASEGNKEFFVIERSNDGIEFKPLAKLDAIGNSYTPKQYTFKDNSPNYVNHYRLKLVDMDGKFSYSDILFVKVEDVSALALHQNIVASTLNYTVNSKKATRIDIYDITGKKVLSSTVKMGNNNISVSSWSLGKYIMRLYCSDGQVFTQQFMKQ